MASRLSALIEEVSQARDKVLEAMEAMGTLLKSLNDKLDCLHRAKAYHTMAIELVNTSFRNESVELNVRGKSFHVRKSLLLEHMNCYFFQMLLLTSTSLQASQSPYLIDRPYEGFDRILESISSQSMDFSGMNEYEVQVLLDNILYFHLPIHNMKWTYQQSADVNFFQKYEITHISSFHSSLVLIATGQGVVFIWDGRSDKLLKTIHAHQWTVVQVIPYNESMICTCSTDNTVKIWDIETNTCLKTFSKHLAVPSCITVLPDGRLCSGSFDRTIIIWNWKTCMIDKTLTGHLECIRSLLLLKDKRLASGSVDGTIKIWRTSSWKCEITISASSSIECMVQLNDGRICSALGNRTLRLWNIATQSSVVLSNRHNEKISGIVQLDDGRICTSSFDTTLKLWNILTGDCEMTLKGHGHVVRGVLQLQDGRICSVSENEPIKLWF